MVLLVSVVTFFITLIWATMRDKKDIEEVSEVFLEVCHYVFLSKSLIGWRIMSLQAFTCMRWLSKRDPCWGNIWFLDVFVHLLFPASHGTQSKVQFILTGDDHATEVLNLISISSEGPSPFLTSGSHAVWPQEEFLQKRIFGHILDDSWQVTISYDVRIIFQAFGSSGEPPDLAR